MDASFHGDSNDTIDSHVRLWRPYISPFWFEVVWAISGPQGPLIRVCEVSMDAHFHGGSNDTIRGRVPPRRLASLFFPHALRFVTGDKFITSIIDIGNNFSLVSLSPSINFIACVNVTREKFPPASLSPAIIVHRCQQHQR
jgi:hypothetical protein